MAWATLPVFAHQGVPQQAASPQNVSAKVPVPNRLTQPIDESNLTTLKGNTHPLALPEYDRGPAPPNLPLNRMLLVLSRSPEQETALESLLDQQQDKSSPNYHGWVTPEQFGQMFGPSDDDVQTVTSWLQSHGFKVSRVSKGRTVIEFSGTHAELQQAFHTEIHKYTVSGEDHWANASDPQIPTALAPVVAGIKSLHNFRPRPMNHLAGKFHKDAKTGVVTPVGSLPVPQFGYGSGCGILGGSCEFLGPFDFATIYDVSPLWNQTTPIDGTGQTIAIVGETDIAPSDWTNFWNFFGVSNPKGTLNIIHDGPAPGIVSDETEADLDTQWSSAVAKGATIDFVVSQSTEVSFGVDLSAAYIVDNNLAGIMSESYGICELFIGTAGNTFYNTLWQQASAQGISVFISSGDQGSAVCDRGDQAAEFGLSVNGFGSTPYNVSVGGTDFNDLNKTATYWSSSNNSNSANAIGYIPEMTWNDTCTNSEIFPYLGTSSAEQTCNNATAQNDGFLGIAGGSGGASSCISSNGQTVSSCVHGYPKPAWQMGRTPSDSKRDVPDVSLFASNGFNNSGYTICEADIQGQCFPESGNFIGVGGTSASSPAFAGIMALVDQKMGGRQGNPNYVLYKMAATNTNSCNSNSVSITGSNSCIFYDTPSGSTIAMPCHAGSPNCNVSTSGDNYGVLSGFGTAAGYDQATGLGSVNVTNLVNQWTVYSGQLTATQFSSFALGPPTTITHGQSTTVTAAVVPKSGTGTPTGTVVLIANTGSAPSGQETVSQVFSLTNGSIPAGNSTLLLPGGHSYSVTAHYSGDGTFAPSDSSPLAVTVNPEPSKTFADLVTFYANGNLASYSASSATYGSGFYLLRIDVGDASASFSTSIGISSNCSKGTTTCPTGSVSFSGSPLAGTSLPLNVEGYAENQALAPGAYTFTANYPGDSSYGPSSTNATFTINKAPTTVSAAVDGLPVQYGNGQQVAATILTNSTGVAPTGTVSFFVDGSPLSVSSIVYEGFPYNGSTSYATLSGSGLGTFLSLGNHTLTATYSGDANYAAGTSPGTTVNVTKGQPIISSWGASPSTINLGQQTTLSAQLFTYGSGAAPTGTITFSDGSTPVSGTVTYTSEAEGLTASLLYTPSSGGTHNITATYSGDTNYLSATTPGTATLTVIGPTFAMTANPASVGVTSPGQSGSTVITFTAQDGFTGSTTLTPSMCTGLPSESSCSFSPSTVTLTAQTSSQTVTLTVNTTAPGSAGMYFWRYTPTRWENPAGIALVCALCIGLVLGCFRTPRNRATAILVLGVFAAILTASSCGGGGNTGPPPPPPNPGTPTGNYSIGVSVTMSNVTESINNISLNVQ